MAYSKILTKVWDLHMDCTKYHKLELTEVLGTNVVKDIGTNVGQKVSMFNLTQPVLTGPKSYCVDTLHEPPLFHLWSEFTCAGKGKNNDLRPRPTSTASRSTGKNNSGKYSSTSCGTAQNQNNVEQITRNWLDLPSDILINILQRINRIEIVLNVQKVCTNWRQICQDPCMWRVIYLDTNFCYQHRPNKWPSFSHKAFKNVVDRSQDQLVDITIVGFCDDGLLQYVADRSSQLRCLEIRSPKYLLYLWHLTKALKKFPFLEELSLQDIDIREEAIRALGRDCPMLKTLKITKQYDIKDDALGFAIAENLPGLRHLELTRLSDTGLRAILDKCCHLQVLEMKMCYPINLIGELELQQIKCVKFSRRVIYLDIDFHIGHRPWPSLLPFSSVGLHKICKNVVDRSQGQLVDITIVGFCDDELLQYIADRSSQLRRLEVRSSSYPMFLGHLTKALKKFPLLEELSLEDIEIEEAIRTLGRDCPMLKTLKLSNEFGLKDDALGLAIAENLPGLRYLELSCCNLSDTGVLAILDRCCHLQVLDLRDYPSYLGKIGKRCLQQIKDGHFFFDIYQLDVRSFNAVFIDVYLNSHSQIADRTSS
ncbi:RNI-like superfamily protein [Artemisia annua]|uniref:RNI-like superfamily protein n=1 Tax=Artemisia annua TaxID=35608 RepID=A0A2U1KTQ1_ARTAN|nr:RNI-like superfamily protein [Artemisia annua]